MNDTTLKTSRNADTVAPSHCPALPFKHRPSKKIFSPSSILQGWSAVYECSLGAFHGNAQPQLVFLFVSSWLDGFLNFEITLSMSLKPNFKILDVFANEMRSSWRD